MASRIEQQIAEMEAYIGECKNATFSSSKIIADRDTLLQMLDDMRNNLPEEIARYQRIIDERESILEDAKQKSQELIDSTAARTNQMVNDQEIMQQAYAQANEVMKLASQHAQTIENEAVNDANNYRMAAVQYMSGLLAEMEKIARQTAESSAASYNSFANCIGQFEATLQNNRNELNQQTQMAAAVQQNGTADSQQTVQPETTDQTSIQEEAEPDTVQNS